MALRHPHADDLPHGNAAYSWADGMAELDRKAQAWLGISGEEFLRRYDAGEYAGIEEDETGRAVVRLSFVAMRARPSSLDADGRIRPLG